jgi:pertactin
MNASNSTLNGDILVDAVSSADVKLEHNTKLNGAVNENNLTGATGINPNEPPTGLPPFTANLGIDSTVDPQAHINFPVPPAPGQFKTLLMNNLSGTGGIFAMNVDLGLIKGDLVEILTKAKVSTWWLSPIVIRDQIFR